MNRFIAFCGLNCEKCDARIATVNEDNDLREKVAKLWSTLNGVEITPEMINCCGCRMDGEKNPYCKSLCPIRQCALGRCIETCGRCSESESCEKTWLNDQEQRRSRDEPEDAELNDPVRR